MLILNDTQLSPLMMTSENSVVPCYSKGNDTDVMAPESPQLPHHRQQGHLHQWDINDNALPTPDTHDPFELWPSGHSRKVYRADSDDARRHVSGWAMRNTNNHNALILKKSCLGVLVCSMDCMLDSGRQVHLRPAICDKARRKQIGKPCPNPGCSGKLDLLSCRGHCGYPVTHFWRHVNGYVYFQAKGYHDHPRPEVKSLSEKGRHAFAKQFKQEGDRLTPVNLKRRFPILTNEEIPDRKMFIPAQDEVMCSCPPFECVCPKSNSHMVHHSSLGYLKDASHFMSHRPGAAPGVEQIAAAPFTQINITNTCLPPSTVDVSIPGYELYPSCPRFGIHPHCLDNEVKMFSSCGSKDDPNGPVRVQNRSHAGEYRPTQYGSYSTILAPGHSGCSRSRAMGYDTEDDVGLDKDEFVRFRLSGEQSFNSTSPSVIKSEPGSEMYSSTTPPSGSPHGAAEMYQPLSPVYQSPSSPRLDDCQAKFSSTQDELTRELQDRNSEPTYITLTSPSRPTDSNSDVREYNSCRLSYISRSPNQTYSTFDSVIYPPQPTQATRVDNVPAPLTPHRSVASFTGPQMPHLRRSPSSAQPRQPAPNSEALSTTGAPHRSNNFPASYSGSNLPLDTTTTTPFTINSDPCLYQTPGSNYSSLGAPYGYFCNDMFQNPSQQAYRNRSINITLTYN